MSQIGIILTLIAQKRLGIETLQTRDADSLDLHDTTVQYPRDTLEATFEAGVESGASSPKVTEGEIAKDQRESRQAKQKALGFSPGQHVHYIAIHHPRRSNP